MMRVKICAQVVPTVQVVFGLLLPFLGFSRPLCGLPDVCQHGAATPSSNKSLCAKAKEIRTVGVILRLGPMMYGDCHLSGFSSHSFPWPLQVNAHVHAEFISIPSQLHTNDLSHTHENFLLQRPGRSFIRQPEESYHHLRLYYLNLIARCFSGA